MKNILLYLLACALTGPMLTLAFVGTIRLVAERMNANFDEDRVVIPSVVVMIFVVLLNAIGVTMLELQRIERQAKAKAGK